MATMYNFAIIKRQGVGPGSEKYEIKGKWVSNKTENRKKAMKYAITHAKPFKTSYGKYDRAENEVRLISNKTYIYPHEYGGRGIPKFESVGAIYQSSWVGPSEWEYISYMEPTANIRYRIDYDGSITRTTAIPRKSETQPWKYGKKW